MEITRKIFEKQKNPKFGNANPQRMNKSFWEFMIRDKKRPDWARQFFDSPYSYPVWCFVRFGITRTELPDGRIVHIAGEHEDWFHDDFYIYNDVIVFQPDGEIAIWGYPKDVFPPTDFHSATLIGDYIYIIGSVGYMDERVPGFTPVYRLNCTSFQIEQLETSGDNPGWISRHQAELDEQNAKILIRGGKVVPIEGASKYEDNFHTYQLDLATLTWEKLAF